MGVLAFDGVFGLLTDLLRFFIGVFVVVLMLRELLTDWLHSAFLSKRMPGPLVMGPSILNTLFSSFSKLKWDILLSHFVPVCPSPQTVYYLMKHKLYFSFHAHIFVLQNTKKWLLNTVYTQIHSLGVLLLFNINQFLYKIWYNINVVTAETYICYICLWWRSPVCFILLSTKI